MCIHGSDVSSLNYAPNCFIYRRLAVICIIPMRKELDGI